LTKTFSKSERSSSSISVVAS